jgi:DNA-directed RNA polymerase specialized sigma24 family protein
VDEATSQAVDDLHATIRKRTPITNPVAWLYKVADRKAWRLNMRHGRDQLRDPVDLDAMGSATEQDGESPATTEEVVAIARTLLRQFPQGGHR